jgi:hypothetical protein
MTVEDVTSQVRWLLKLCKERAFGDNTLAVVRYANSLLLKALNEQEESYVEEK